MSEQEQQYIADFTIHLLRIVTYVAIAKKFAKHPKYFVPMEKYTANILKFLNY